MPEFDSSEFESLNPEAPQLTIPDACLACPRQCALTEDLEGASMSHAKWIALGNITMDERFDAASKGMFENLPGMTDDTIEASQTTTRKMVGMMIDMVADEMHEIEERSGTLSEACDGVLKMRASKDGRTYTVAICTSEQEYAPEDEPQKRTMAYVQVTNDGENQ